MLLPAAELRGGHMSRAEGGWDSPWLMQQQSPPQDPPLKEPGPEWRSCLQPILTGNGGGFPGAPGRALSLPHSARKPSTLWGLGLWQHPGPGALNACPPTLRWEMGPKQIPAASHSRLLLLEKDGGRTAGLGGARRCLLGLALPVPIPVVHRFDFLQLLLQLLLRSQDLLRLLVLRDTAASVPQPVPGSWP